MDARQAGPGVIAKLDGCLGLWTHEGFLEVATVFEDADFHEFFCQITPIDVVERMQIGSRPSSRAERTGIEALRSIPWAHAWSQCRYMVPGWYGAGSALELANRALGEAASTIQNGGDIGTALAAANALLIEAGFDPVDYVELRDAETLAPVTSLSRPARILAAARLGGTRLIDTIAAQSDAQSGARGIRELERIRDDNLVAIMEALSRQNKGKGWGAGALHNDYTKRLAWLAATAWWGGVGAGAVASATGVLVTWGLRSQHLFDVVPAARAAIFEGMPDAVFVLDRAYRVVDHRLGAGPRVGQAGYLFEPRPYSRSRRAASCSGLRASNCSSVWRDAFRSPTRCRVRAA